MSERGQAVSYDLAMAMFIFVMVLAGIIMLWTSNLKSFETQFSFNEAQVKAFLLSDLLLKSPGVPVDWETRDLNGVTSLGLARKDRVLDSGKVLRFKDWVDSNYSEVKAKLALPTYEVFIQLDAVDPMTADLNFGVPPPGNAVRVSVRRIAVYGDSEAIVDVTLYQTP
ncbi:MAG: hypothetical protein HY917_03055 [Candidatus Diapherotrites archaeon]|nr:hypothetical protein [Candidatus Diapherotrites archaeon]